MQDLDRRQKARIHFNTSVVLKTEGQEFTAEALSRDIGLDGIFLATDAKLQINQSCQLTITLTGTSSKLELSVQGRVVRLDPNGLAIKFTEFDIDSYILLKNFVKYNLQNS